jgi:hypothetical protein
MDERVHDEKYLVVDLSEGEKAKEYPVRWTYADPWEREGICRTTELWLRRIPGGEISMGPVRNGEEEQHHRYATLPDYYLGILQCTCKQYGQVMGLRFSGGREPMPVEGVTNASIRGTDCTIWDPVKPESFLGLLRAKTGLAFELPTDAQLEYACRLQADGVTVGPVERLAPYEDTPEDPRTGLGLLDMRGNVRWEWCLPVDAPKTPPAKEKEPGFWSRLFSFLDSPKKLAHDPSSDGYYVGTCGEWFDYKWCFGHFHGVIAQTMYDGCKRRLSFRVCLPAVPAVDWKRPGAPYAG